MNNIGHYDFTKPIIMDHGNQQTINESIPDATTRRRRNPYSDKDYMYGEDDPEFTEEVKGDTWKLILITLAASIGVGVMFAAMVNFLLNYFL
jgi:hypothetical protein